MDIPATTNKRKRLSSPDPVESITERFKNIKLKDNIEQNSALEEQFVYQYLKNKYSSQTDLISIKWENENGESNLPYDILLIDNGKKHYIEVKRVRSMNRHTFSISINEIEAILDYKENYSIYFVFLEDKKFIIFDVRQYLTERKQ